MAILFVGGARPCVPPVFVLTDSGRGARNCVRAECRADIVVLQNVRGSHGRIYTLCRIPDLSSGMWERCADAEAQAGCRNF